MSWLDIFVINAAYPAAFISKAEVRDWPLIGWLAAKNETVFLRRGSRGHARIVNAEIASLLGRGRQVALFPEGTTTDGSHVHPFHAALLQPAIDAGAPIQPLALCYRLPDGSFTRAPAYDGDVSLLDCLKAIVAEIGASGPGDMGKVMGVVKTRLAGKADMGQVSAAVKAALAP